MKLESKNYEAKNDEAKNYEAKTTTRPVSSILKTRVDTPLRKAYNSQAVAFFHWSVPGTGLGGRSRACACMLKIRRPVCELDMTE